MAKRVNWDYIKPMYCAGSMSNCEIARQYESDHADSEEWKATITEASIRKRAKSKKWQRNIADKVQAQIKENLVREEVRDSNLSEPELIKAAAEKPTQVRLLQRGRAKNLAEIGDKLTAELTAELSYDPAESEEGKPRDKMGLGHMAQIFSTLVGARDRLQKMESTAFGLDEPEAESLMRKQMALAEVFKMLPANVQEEIRKKAAAKVNVSD
ncbi:MAG: hypothetical protein JEZ12_21530 [Desulfobacterium sp.]|nr:hypothetical protein [Desulfobacterium sp.]